MNNPVIYQRDTATGNFGNPDNFLPVANHQLYARILRLWFLDDQAGDWHGKCAMEGIVRDVIYPDQALVWC